MKTIKNKLSVTATWFADLSQPEQEAYLKKHPSSKLLPSNKLKETHETVKNLNKEKIAHLNRGTHTTPEGKAVNEKLKPLIQSIHDHNKEEYEKQSDHNVKTGKTTQEQQDAIDKSWGRKPTNEEHSSIGSGMKIIKAKTSLEIASDWFESLTEKKQKEYIAEHPDSKFAHKLGKSKPNPKVTKSKQAQMEHLKGEGVDLTEDYHSLDRNKQHVLHTVADKSGMDGNAAGASKGRALLFNTSSHNSKLNELKTKLMTLREQADKEGDTAKGDMIAEKIDKLRDQISALINK